MKARKQLQLFAAVPQRVRRESAGTYHSVLLLRRRGFRVWRAGDMHLVEGKRCATRVLMAMAMTGGEWYDIHDLWKDENAARRAAGTGEP